MTLSRLLVLGLLAMATACVPARHFRSDREHDRAPFPSGWAGEYSGKLSILGPAGTVQEVDMSVTIGPEQAAGRWGWMIQYEGQPPREYTLVTVDEGAGHYRIDEGNTIVLEAWRRGDDLLVPFSMDGELLATRYRREGEVLTFEITTIGLSPAVVTGNRGDVPAVGSHAVQGFQRGELRRVGPAQPR